jgi:polar amino acid transport system substrate-binding protein
VKTIAAFLCSLALCHAQGIAPTGTLRAIFLATNPVQGRVDPKTGVVTGPAADLTRDLGKRLNLPVTISGVPSVQALIASLKAHTADIGFLAFDPGRAVEVDFSRVYSLSWSSYIVPADSPFHSVADVDTQGVRIGAASGDSPQLYLSKNLKHATVTAYPNPVTEAIVRRLMNRELEAWGANRQRLIEMAAAHPNLRVLDGNYSAVQQAIAVSKGNRAALDIINSFLEQALSSGLIRKAIDEAGLGSSVDVAPQ